MMTECHHREKVVKELGVSRPLTVAEAGRKGGLTLSVKRGRAWFAQIGAKGQRALRAKYPDMAQKWGKRGGRPKKPALSYLREADK